MKKLRDIVICICLIYLCTFSVNLRPYAAEKTLGTLKKELASLEKQLEENQNAQALTEEQIAQTEQNIETIKNEITSLNTEIKDLGEEINKLNDDIEKKEEEIKKLINFVQVSNGESTYMEYIFGAKDFTDFIYRVAVSEQVVDYNDKLIEEYNQLIETNKKKTAELQKKQEEAMQKQQQLELERVKLGQKMSDLGEGEQDLASQIKTAKASIQKLENDGCRDNETASACFQRKNPPSSGGGGIISDTGFIRPITHGTITSEYNSGRPHPTLGGVRFHNGIDIGVSGGTPVYPTANGRVGAIVRRASCGGNQVFIYHNINGKTYTSGYLHLRSINVSVGQQVTTNTMIATSGGDPSVEWWDGCSTGAHLHFSLANGLYYSDYYDYDTYLAHTFNPRNKVNFPSTGGDFSGR